MKEKTCYCGKIFTTSIWRKYYCSKKCSKEGERRSKRDHEFLGRQMQEKKWKLRDAKKNRSGEKQRRYRIKNKRYIYFQMIIKKHVGMYIPMKVTKKIYAEIEDLARGKDE